MNIVVRINFGSKLKNSSSAIGYYSYTHHRCVPLFAVEDPEIG